MAEAENLPRLRQSARRLLPGPGTGGPAGAAGNSARRCGVGCLPLRPRGRIIPPNGGVRDGMALVSGDLATGKAGPAESAHSFEALLTPLLEPAYGTALRLTRNPADAEDLVSR